MSEMMDIFCIPDQTTDYWPLNLLAAVERKKGELTLAARPADFEASLAYVLNLLSERERKVLLLRYMKRMTYEAIGKDFGVTRERIRQVEAKTLRKLNHHSLKRLLQYGVMGVIRQEDARARDGAIAQMEDANLPLEHLGLSVRPYNCLLRAGVKTVRDILAMDNEQLMRVRNLGGRSAAEIIFKLESLGFDCERLGGKKVVEA